MYKVVGQSTFEFALSHQRSGAVFIGPVMMRLDGTWQIQTAYQIWFAGLKYCRNKTESFKNWNKLKWENFLLNKFKGSACRKNRCIIYLWPLCLGAFGQSDPLHFLITLALYLYYNVHQYLDPRQRRMWIVGDAARHDDRRVGLSLIYRTWSNSDYRQILTHNIYA